MSDKFKLDCKFGEVNYLKKLRKADNSESKTYLLKVSNPYLKTGTIEGKRYINPTGGPLIMVGKELKAIEPEVSIGVVKSIDFTTGYGYTITFT